jgi:formylglycine-generating enzyme required for sulfatase activity
MSMRSICRSWVVLWVVGGCTNLRDDPLPGTVATDVPVVAEVSLELDGSVATDTSVLGDRVAVGDLPSTTLGCPADMQAIPAGMFQMGSSSGNADTRPPHAVRLHAFCMDPTEVTVSAYRACASCTTPGTGSACNWGVSSRDRHPVNCVTWFQAEAFCRTLGKRLPTEAEWEYAARGPEGRLYPWGNTYPMGQLCWDRRSSGSCTVGAFPAGDTPLHLHDLAGNVNEWTADWYGPYASGATVQEDPAGPVSGDQRVHRSGNWSFNLETGYVAYFRYHASPSTQNDEIGFRCASDPR